MIVGIRTLVTRITVSVRLSTPPIIPPDPFMNNHPYMTMDELIYIHFIYKETLKPSNSKSRELLNF